MEFDCVAAEGIAFNWNFARLKMRMMVLRALGKMNE